MTSTAHQPVKPCRLALMVGHTKSTSAPAMQQDSVRCWNLTSRVGAKLQFRKGSEDRPIPEAGNGALKFDPGQRRMASRSVNVDAFRWKSSKPMELAVHV